jgi:hypothetical protein
MSIPNPDPGGRDGRNDPDNRSKSMANHKHDRNFPTNDNGKAVTPAAAGGAANDNEKALATPPAGGALISLAALGAALNKVDLSSVVGRSGLALRNTRAEKTPGPTGSGRISPKLAAVGPSIPPHSCGVGFVSTIPASRASISCRSASRSPISPRSPTLATLGKSSGVST